MQLKTKLLLGVGLLLFIMAMLMYFLPIRFVRQDIYKAADAIHHLLIAEHQQLIASQQKWLADEFRRAKENTNALLFMVYEDAQIKEKLTSSQSTDETVWQILMHIAALNQDVGFVQFHDSTHKKAAVITPHATHLYPIDKLAKKDHFVKLTLLNEKGSPAYIGVPLPQDKQAATGFTFYALLDMQKVKEQIPLLHEEIKDLTPAFIEHELDLASFELADQPALQWAMKIQLMNTLTPFYVEGFVIQNNTILPAGLARIDATGNGHAILSKEAYSESVLFDDVTYYKEHQPVTSLQPIADGTSILSHEEFAYAANTLLLSPDYLSIGTSLDFLIHELALASNRMIFLKVNEGAWIGYDGNGRRLSYDKVQEFVHSGAFEKKLGIVDIKGKTLFFGEVGTLANGRLVFYDFHEFGGERSILSTLLALEEKLTGRISNQLLIINLFAIIVVLLFIGRMAYIIIGPILKLSTATKAVVAGKYGEVHLPDVGHRKDEVATLTHAFGAMVEGLQDREKIRGVLDKVVSKEIADEILKSRIHLGGEDRPVTMLFGDIRGFTSMTAALTPQKTIEMLNACMTRVSRVIEGEGGLIDKYVGDEVMALFGAPVFHPDHPIRAISAGLLILKSLKLWNEERTALGEPIIEMGVGVHAGVVVAGNMGAEDRLNYTVLGTNVNLASRLCNAAQPGQLLVSEEILKLPDVKTSFYVKQLPPMLFKGFDKPMNVYEVIDFKWNIST